MSDILSYSENYKNKGTAYIPMNAENLLVESELNELTKLCLEVKKEHIKIGDAGEKNYLEVGRFMTDNLNPEIVNKDFSIPLLKIISKKNIKITISRVLGIKEDEVNYRRVQFNEIKKDCFVGYHLDVDSNPDYIAACVIQLGKKFEGGLYRVYQKDNTFIDYKPEFGSLIISNCLYPHEVTKVTSGSRGSLVFFISKYKGKNRRFI